VASLTLGSRECELKPPRWRVVTGRAISRLPAPVRSAFWRTRRARARAHRRALEARGDYSLSTPALYDMDARLERHLNFDGGFFVEAGANDGYSQSNTYRLERLRGWRGVLIEPVPTLYREARIERDNSQVFNCALVPKDNNGDPVRLIYGGMMTTVVGTRGSETADRAWVEKAHAVAQEEPEHEFSVPGRTLSSILDEVRAPEIDLLSLDVEGFEPQVLAGLEFERHAPRWILVEIREGGGSREEIEVILGSLYVGVEQISPYDMLYCRCD
jgi:FkbM family methyltransferase